MIRLAVGLTLAGALTAAALAGAVAAVADLLPTRSPALDDQPAHIIATIAKETQ